MGQKVRELSAQWGVWSKWRQWALLGRESGALGGWSSLLHVPAVTSWMGAAAGRGGREPVTAINFTELLGGQECQCLWKCGGLLSITINHTGINVFYHCWWLIIHTSSLPSNLLLLEAFFSSPWGFPVFFQGHCVPLCTTHGWGGAVMSMVPLALSCAYTAVCSDPVPRLLCTILLLNPHWISLGPL